MNYIYTLSDPDTKEVRYVGKTDNIKERYRKHIYNITRRKTYLYSWMKSLSKLPLLEIIDEVENDWQFWEKYWISQFITWGFNLTNLTIGGDGGTNFFSDFTIIKLRELNSGEKNPFYGKKHTKETIEKIKFANTGKIVSEETKIKISNSKMGHTVTPETIEKFRFNNLNGITGMKGKKHSVETKIKMSNSSIGKKKSKDHIEKMIEKSKKKIICNENIIYNSIEDASRDLNIRRDMISMCLINKRESYQGYYFKYFDKIKTIERECIYCGKIYIAQRKSSLYCSSECTKKSKKGSQL